MKLLKDLPINPPEPFYILCGRCECEIYQGETAYAIDGAHKPICKECIEETISDMSTDQKASLLGAEQIIVDSTWEEWI